MDRAFVLGNGRSRLGLDLDSLRTAGKIFGCNALYRDFSPDVLIATDPGITAEIEQSGYPQNHEFYTRKPGHTFSKRITKNVGYSSGPIAITYAALENFLNIYFIGFDLTGIDNNRHNNVYSSTNNYRDANSTATYYGNWINQITSIAKEFHTLNFIRVGNVSQYKPEKWNLPNIKFQTINEFLSEVNTVSWQKQNE
jgi:hypothetical protein